MDTNLKENNKTHCIGNRAISTTLGILLLTFILAVISVCSYAPIKDATIKDKTLKSTQEYLNSYIFAYNLMDLTYYLGQSKIEYPENNDPRYDNLENIKYHIQDQNNNVVASNLDDKSLAAEIKGSQFYLHITIDDQGNPTVIDAPKSFNKSAFIDNFKQSPLPQVPNSETPSQGLASQPNYLANLDIVYVVPQNLTSNNDLFMREVKEFNLEGCIVLIATIGGISIFLLVILAFAIPYAAQKQASLVKIFNNLYLELKFLVWLTFFVICVGILGLITSSNNNTAFYYLNIIHDANLYFYLIGIPVTFVLYTLIYLSITYIKHIYHTGFKEGLLNNSIFGKLLLSINNHIIKTVKQIVEVDITKDSTQQLFKLLGLNLFVLIVIALTNGLGVFLALAYTVLLFKYSIKVLDKVKALNEASGQLAKGDFDIALPEDMAILNSFAKNLNNIKDGFKVAVEKEIKSQNMKTQLISNVSHDLKTPLTSIITYVDLLKTEGLTKETQAEYIDVLDQKSKRLKVLIEDLFEASKASSGNIELHLESVDVIALLRQTMGEMEEKINESMLRMKVNLPENKVICQLDGARTYRVFENIIGNILKYTMPNTRVYIDAVESETDVSFIFKNISNYEMNFDPTEITERSFRGDKSRNTEGSGLGLAIAKSLVDLQNGSLEINIDGDLFKLTVTFPKP
ncbi:sensor histidine kinase [Peptococcaceae bacterium 1198_IL3148]